MSGAHRAGLTTSTSPGPFAQEGPRGRGGGDENSVDNTNTATRNQPVSPTNNGRKVLMSTQ